MDVFLMVRRKKTTIFTDCKESTSVVELKKMIQGILKIAPENQRLFKDSQIMEDSSSLSDYGLVSSVSRAQCPATIGLAIRLDNGEFEQLDIVSLSSPPDLPDVMKPQEPSNHDQSN
uniref:Elongin-B n=1 Tax=Lynceus sp. MCZ IZ 141354 TaxID=1930659 RepID=A0A9N6ZGB0_9CRUS|nr:EOG090X0JP1 [Lynceus sp. MCZ IZ 141354]